MTTSPYARWNAAETAAWEAFEAATRGNVTQEAEAAAWQVYIAALAAAEVAAYS